MASGSDGGGAGVSQTIVNGTVGAPWIFSILLMVCVFLLGATVALLIFVWSAEGKTQTELRILQVHTQDLNAILLREGVIRPGELETPTAPGTTAKPADRRH